MSQKRNYKQYPKEFKEEAVALREHMKADVAKYMRYYNTERLHSANNDLSPAEFENSECSKLKKHTYPGQEEDSGSKEWVTKL